MFKALLDRITGRPTRPPTHPPRLPAWIRDLVLSNDFQTTFAAPGHYEMLAGNVVLDVDRHDDGTLTVTAHNGRGTFAKETFA